MRKEEHNVLLGLFLEHSIWVKSTDTQYLVFKTIADFMHNHKRVRARAGPRIIAPNVGKHVQDFSQPRDRKGRSYIAL